MPHLGPLTRHGKKVGVLHIIIKVYDLNIFFYPGSGRGGGVGGCPAGGDGDARRQLPVSCARGGAAREAGRHHERGHQPGRARGAGGAAAGLPGPGEHGSRTQPA